MTSDKAAEPRTAATMRLREAIDAERATSGGNAMTPLSVVGFISGPWLDYIAEPYAAEAAALRAAIERIKTHAERHLRDDGKFAATDVHMATYDLDVSRAALEDTSR